MLEALPHAVSFGNAVLVSSELFRLSVLHDLICSFCLLSFEIKLGMVFVVRALSCKLYILGLY